MLLKTDLEVGVDDDLDNENMGFAGKVALLASAVTVAPPPPNAFEVLKGEVWALPKVDGIVLEFVEVLVFAFPPNAKGDDVDEDCILVVLPNVDVPPNSANAVFDGSAPPVLGVALLVWVLTKGDEFTPVEPNAPNPVFAGSPPDCVEADA